MNNQLLREIATRHRNEIMEPYDAMMGVDGFDAICTFCDLMGGRSVYIPSKRTIFMGCLMKAAEKEFTGFNFPELSLKYGFSERYFRKLMRDK